LAGKSVGKQTLGIARRYNIMMDVREAARMGSGSNFMRIMFHGSFSYQ
jgi:hypothetical protein